MVKIIAEIAQGYEGKPDYCDYYVRAAAKAGADAVKFQIVYADDVAEPGYEYYEWFKQLEMDVSVWQNTAKTAHDLGIKMYCDVSGERALNIAKQVPLDGIKIHSSNFFNHALIKEVCDMVPQVFVSIGGAYEEEVEALVTKIEEWGHRDKLTLLYGFQSEPTPIEKSNIARLSYLKNKFSDLEVGYLDHVTGDYHEPSCISAMAVALGADWIEKHLTISRHMEVEDYVSALEPEEFKRYIETMKTLRQAVGESSFNLNEDEKLYRGKAIKKLLTLKPLKAGDVIKADDFILKRTAKLKPEEGIHDPQKILGKTLAQDLNAEEPILEVHVQ
jgi:N,N'-diacetyllegionaminate synthase